VNLKITLNVSIGQKYVPLHACNHKNTTTLIFSGEVCLDKDQQ
jgi:hypothetical protein